MILANSQFSRAFFNGLAKSGKKNNSSNNTKLSMAAMGAGDVAPANFSMIEMQPEIWELISKFLPAQCLYVLEGSNRHLRATLQEDSIWATNLQVHVDMAGNLALGEGLSIRSLHRSVVRAMRRRAASSSSESWFRTGEAEVGVEAGEGGDAVGAYERWMRERGGVQVRMGAQLAREAFGASSRDHEAEHESHLLTESVCAHKAARVASAAEQARQASLDLARSLHPQPGEGGGGARPPRLVRQG